MNTKQVPLVEPFQKAVIFLAFEEKDLGYSLLRKFYRYGSWSDSQESLVRKLLAKATQFVESHT